MCGDLCQDFYLNNQLESPKSLVEAQPGGTGM